MSTFREGDMCASTNFPEKLFVSTVHKAKGLEFENVIVMRAVAGRYPHFAHNTTAKLDENKRLFYVAISRAMKRLIISGSSDEELTPFINPILHRFTLRFLFHDYLIEISNEEMRVIHNNSIVRRYNRINNMHKNAINQLTLRRYIMQQWGQTPFLDAVDRLLA